MSDIFASFLDPIEIKLISKLSFFFPKTLPYFVFPTSGGLPFALSDGIRSLFPSISSLSRFPSHLFLCDSDLP